MSRIVLVRHGQASFWSAEYDQLSPLGVEQSRLLGAHWGATGRRFARVYTGPRNRQRDTCAAATDAFARVGGNRLPAAVEVHGFDEHHGQAVCAATLSPAPALKESDEEARRAYASTTEFVSTVSRMSLASFNLVSHVPDHLVTLV